MTRMKEVAKREEIQPFSFKSAIMNSTFVLTAQNPDVFHMRVAQHLRGASVLADMLLVFTKSLFMTLGLLAG